MTEAKKGPIKGKRRGYSAERRLVKLLSKKPGNYVFRVPVSGSRPPRNSPTAFPDVFSVNNIEDRIVAFEVKSTSKNKVRVKRRQLIKLMKFLSVFKKYKRREAVVAVWFSKEEKWVFKLVTDPLCTEDVVVTINDKSTWTP